MKKLLVLVCLFISFTAFAAEQDSVKVAKRNELTLEQQAKKVQQQKKASEVQKRFNKFSKDRFAVDFIFSNWIYNKNDARFVGGDLKPKWYSRGVNIYFSWDFRIKNSRFSFAPGIGYSCSNIYSRHEMIEDSVGIHITALSNPDDYKVNKITLQYLDIPVEFRIKTNPDKLDNCWKFAIGFKAGVRLDAHTKTKTKIDNVTKVNVERRFPDFNQFRFGPMIRIGYSSFNLTAYYGVLNVFKKDRGPKANEFAVGISFNGL